MCEIKGLMYNQYNQLSWQLLCEKFSKKYLTRPIMNYYYCLSCGHIKLNFEKVFIDSEKNDPCNFPVFPLLILLKS